jgi:hypothetical protein
MLDFNPELGIGGGIHNKEHDLRPRDVVTNHIQPTLLY